MITVRSRLDDGIHDRATAATEFSRIRVRLNLELLDRIYVGSKNHAAIVVGVVVDAVEKKIIQRSARAVRYEAVLSACAASAGITIGSGTGTHHTRAQRGELNIVATVERQFFDLRGAHYLSERRCVGLNVRTPP